MDADDTTTCRTGKVTSARRYLSRAPRPGRESRHSRRGIVTEQDKLAADFEMPFDTIAAVLGRTTAATKMLASRVRGRIRLGAPAPDAHSAARGVVDALPTPRLSHPRGLMPMGVAFTGLA